MFAVRPSPRPRSSTKTRGPPPRDCICRFARSQTPSALHCLCKGSNVMPSDDSNIPAEEITSEGRPQLRADRAGYILDGERVEGFADRTDVDERGRRALAEWAESFTPDRLEDEQKRI